MLGAANNTRLGRWDDEVSASPLLPTDVRSLHDDPFAASVHSKTFSRAKAANHARFAWPQLPGLEGELGTLVRQPCFNDALSKRSKCHDTRALETQGLK